MMLVRILTLTLIVLLSGCAMQPLTERDAIKENQIVTVDPESDDFKRNGEIKYEPTPDHVVVGAEKGVLVEVHKAESIKDEAIDITLQVWDVTATNTNKSPVCVTALWRLMDFEYISEGPSEVYVPPFALVKLGEMQQQLWILDGVPVAPPPSGYLKQLRVRGTIKGAKPGLECEYITPDEDVETYYPDKDAN